ncbi:hypothetical protein ACETU7_35480 [Rhodococcus sp. 3Y1]
MANEFGVTAWGRAWLRTVERTAASGPNPSLPTARTLARNGSVEFTVVSSGTVVAEVSTKAKTSSVTIGVPLWTKSEIAAVKSLLRSAGRRTDPSPPANCRTASSPNCRLEISQ